MDSTFFHAIFVFITFFALYNPVSNTAIFFALSVRKHKHERKKIAVKSISLAFIILTVCCVSGKSIFESAAIPVSSFQVIGGFFVMIIGVQMLSRNLQEIYNEERLEDISDKDIAFYPLAFPLMAGPGAISAAVAFSVTDSAVKIVINIFSLALISVITYYCFRSIYKFSNRFNIKLLKMTTRIIGIIVIIAGNVLIINGLQGS